MKSWLQNIPIYLIILWSALFGFFFFLFFKKNKTEGRFLLPSSFLLECVWHSNVNAKSNFLVLTAIKLQKNVRMCCCHGQTLSLLLLLKDNRDSGLAFHWETVMWGCEITVGDHSGDSQGYAFYCIRCWTYATVWWHMIPWEFFLNSISGWVWTSW